MVVACLVGMVGARRTRSMTDTRGQYGLKIGDKFALYASYKSFAVLEDEAIDSIQLTPLKRFSPPISLYFPPEQEEEITQILSDYLPLEERNHDPIDRLMKRMHF